MFQNNVICKMLSIKYPIFQAGMVWVSGGKLAAAAANAGILGVVGAGSMKPDLLKKHILKAKSLTKKPIAINIPLLYHGAKEQIDTALKEGIRIFITSAGNPKKFTPYLKENGAIVIHVVSNPYLAKKCEDAGVDIIVAEGFEAGGHNGKDELTTMVLIPQVKKAVSIPVVAAGGIGFGSQMAASFMLGADGVQIGSRFVTSIESSAHQNFKDAILKSTYSDTMLQMKKVVPVRLLKNKFSDTIFSLENENASKEKLIEVLGKGRAKKGMLEGDLDEGELEIGQVSGQIDQILTVKEIVDEIVSDYKLTISKSADSLI